MQFSYLSAHRSKDIKKSIFAIATLVIKELKIKKAIKINELAEFLKKHLSINQQQFVLALNFLYILCVIEFKKETDEIVYIK